MDWKIVEKDGNPTKADTYYCIVIHPEVFRDEKANEWVETGKLIAERDTRFFADLEQTPDLKSWAMENQPDTGLVWTEQTGSHLGEYVYAWLPNVDEELPELPEGVEYDN